MKAACSSSIARVLVVAALGLISACGVILDIPGGDFLFGHDDPDAGAGTPDAESVTPDAGDGTPDAGASMPDTGIAVPDAAPAPDARTDPPDLLPAAYVKASNTDAGDHFGWSVAISGDTMAISAYREDSPASGVDGSQGNGLPNSGAVYVFRRAGEDWVQEAYLKASNPNDSDELGYALALWGDTLAVAAWGERSAATGVDGDQLDNSARDAGAVYVFRRTGATWAQEAYIKASNTGARDEFGASLALWEDTLAVGAPEEDSSAVGVDGDQENEGAQDSGAVYVFRRTGTTWAQEAYIKASNTEASDEFGVSVALYGDTLAVGAYLEDSIATGVGGDEGDRSAIDSGAVYVFRRTGAVWAQEAYVKASNTGAGDLFGLRIALWEDTLAVGAPMEDSSATGVDGAQDNDGTGDSGAVYVFRHDGGAWAQEGYLKASNTGVNDQFGQWVAIAGDMLVAGAPLEDSRAAGQGGSPDDDDAQDSGAGYLFQRTAGAWSQQPFIKPAVDAGDRFGNATAISADTLIVTAPLEDSAAIGIGGDPGDDSAPDSGAAYVFDY